MRTFECADCQHAWQLMFGTGGRGRDLSCPQCGSRNVHRAEQDRGWVDTARSVRSDEGQ